MSISVCMIVRDESANIRRCLESVAPIADEIIVVDTGSTDDTINICKNYTDKIYHFLWCDDFAAARNYSISKATGDWILWMDADDVLRAQDHERIKAVSLWPQNRYLIFTAQNVSPCNHPKVNACDFVQGRMFPNHKGVTFEGALHEQFADSAIRAGLVAFYVLDVMIEHHGYKDVDVCDKKFARNDRIRAQIMAAA